ncbi:MAG TPA: YqaE/Pmp3 family membrane protein [Phaeodactylibacter sp.]|nr:YqaE/Pmp3 family membrane protein [Phaeodactylibacter sp.]
MSVLMKRFYVFLFAIFFSVNGFAVGTTGVVKAKAEMAKVSPEMAQMSIDDFLALTPSKYKKMTGERLGFKKTLALKAAQKAVKKHMKKGSDIDKSLYIVLAILGFGWLAMGLLSDWSGNDWIVNLVLTFLCWLPGLIHALVKMKDYYG